MIDDASNIFTAEAITYIRGAIHRAGYMECLFICRHDGERIIAADLAAVGNRSSVPMVMRELYGNTCAIVHNHPSGNMEASHSDISIAQMCGVANMIVDNDVSKVRIIIPIRNQEDEYYW